ncbi:alpha/beta hydrolase [Acidovorax sp. SRB_14]|uniref:alpha/beta hydrolase n=1 Tax=Acidovorax sp. SRB_14 TaxID=1962699 RepID=UPI001564444A|nr:alpha/beta hydrolase [Acidovorax sp. SRB_14]
MSPVPRTLAARFARAVGRCAGRGALVLASAWLAGCAAPAGPPPLPGERAGFAVRLLPADRGQHLQVLERAERAAPARYRVIVVPGSGCAGMGPVAARYFAGLLHAQLLVLHKPWMDADAATAPGDCSADFVRADALGAWRDHARAALRADAAARAGTPPLPQLLVGISEGAELLPALTPEVPHLAGLVLLGASGLDPRDAGALQAQRHGALARWQALGLAQAGAWPDGRVLEGRSLRYWRDLWHWPLAGPLSTGPWPLLQVWGADDALVPAEAYARFADRARTRAAPYCARSLAGADHGLQGPDQDGVQQVWAWLEQWARAPLAGWCAAVPP